MVKNHWIPKHVPMRLSAVKQPGGSVGKLADIRIRNDLQVDDLVGKTHDVGKTNELQVDEFLTAVNGKISRNTKVGLECFYLCLEFFVN